MQGSQHLWRRGGLWGNLQVDLLKASRGLGKKAVGVFAAAKVASMAFGIQKLPSVRRGRAACLQAPLSPAGVCLTQTQPKPFHPSMESLQGRICSRRDLTNCLRKRRRLLQSLGLTKGFGTVSQCRDAVFVASGTLLRAACWQQERPGGVLSRQQSHHRCPQC